MNKENAISKINNYGKVGKIITIVMMVFIALSILATASASIFLKTIPDDVMSLRVGTKAELTINPKAFDIDTDEAVVNEMLDSFNKGNIEGGLNLGVVSLKLDEAEIVDGKFIARTDEGVGLISLNKIGNALIIAVVSLVLSFVSVFFGDRLCKAFEKCESPFEANVINKMRYFAFSLLPWAVFSSIPEAIVSKTFGDNLKTHMDVDMNVIFTVLIILALTIVFKYGAILQQESDETL